MASLQQIKDRFYIRFRFAREAFRRSLEVTDRDEAEAVRKQVELTLHRIKTGVLPTPPPDADVALFIISGGKVEKKIVLPEPSPPPPAPETLGSVWAGYKASFPEGAKESLTTEGTHFRHFFRLLGETTPYSSLTTDDMQKYVNIRLEEPGHRGKTVAPDTVKCEIETFAHVWNKYALPRKLVQGTFDQCFGELNLGKKRSRPPFQTWDQIERRIARGGLTETQVGDLWACLFLDLDQVAAVLEFVRTQTTGPAWLYPMFAFAAHTGARRSEMIRSEVDDWDFENKVVQIGEKKRNKDVDITYRPVAVSPFLAEIMEAWFKHHPGGRYTLCAARGQPITKNLAAKGFRDAVDGSKWQVLHGWHLFRHSLASNMACRGIDQRFIDATLGHQTEEMRRRYRHLFPSQQQAVMASIFAKR